MRISYLSNIQTVYMLPDFIQQRVGSKHVFLQAIYQLLQLLGLLHNLLHVILFVSLLHVIRATSHTFISPCTILEN